MSKGPRTRPRIRFNLLVSQSLVIALAPPLLLLALFMAFAFFNTTLSYSVENRNGFLGQAMAWPLLIFGSAFVSWTYRAARTLRAHLRGPSAERIADLLARDPRSFVLILRPFVGSSTLRVLDGSSLLSSFVCVEEVVARVVRDQLGASTYTLVDSDVGVLTPGPHYVVADQADWQVPVDALLARATAVVIVVPPGGELKPGLRWEVERLAARGFLGRVAIVLPRPRHPAYAQARVTLDQILQILEVPTLGAEPTKLVLAYPRADGTSIHWAPPENTYLIDSEPYRLGLREGLEYATQAKLIATAPRS